MAKCVYIGNRLVMYSQENIGLKVVVRFTDKAVFSTTGKHLSNIETLVLQGAWKGQKYPQIASETGYAIEYLKNDIGPKLWRRLSQVFGERVKKANVKIVLQQQLYSEEEMGVTTQEEKTEETNNQVIDEIRLEPTQFILQEDQGFSVQSENRVTSYSVQNSISSLEVREQNLPLTTFIVE